jgi:hypothetical protein
MFGQVPHREARMKKLGLIVTPDGVMKVFPMADSPDGAKAGLDFWEAVIEDIEQFNRAIRQRMARDRGSTKREGTLIQS